MDRARLSKQNNWFDELGRIYIYFTVENIKLALKCSKGKVLKMLREFDTKNYGKGVGKSVGKSIGEFVDNIVNEVFEPNTTPKNELLLEQN